jgi:Phosphomannomutase
MVTRSLVAGLMSVGVNIINLDATAIPITRTAIPTLNVAGGIHVRLSPERADYILIEFLDSKGISITKSKEKKSKELILKKIYDGRKFPKLVMLVMLLI